MSFHSFISYHISSSSLRGMYLSAFTIKQINEYNISNLLTFYKLAIIAEIVFLWITNILKYLIMNFEF